MTKEEILYEMDLIADFEVSTYALEKMEEYIHSAICSYVDAHFDPQSIAQIPGINAYVQSSIRSSHGTSPLTVNLEFDSATTGLVPWTVISNALSAKKPGRIFRFIYAPTAKPDGIKCEKRSISFRSKQAVAVELDYSLLRASATNLQFTIDSEGIWILPAKKYNVVIQAIMQPLVVTDTVDCELPQQTKRWISTRAVLNYAIAVQDSRLAKIAGDLLLQIAI